MNILGLDLGMANFGYSVTQNNVSESGYIESRVIQNGLITNTVKQLKEGNLYKLDLIGFLSEFESILQNNPDIEVVVAERFMDRSSVLKSKGKPAALKTITLETTNIMLGALTTLIALKYPNIELLFLGASAWKNSFNQIRRKNNVRELSELYKICNAQEHCVDATLQSIYGAGKQFNINPYLKFQDEYQAEQLLKGVEDTTKAKITKRRKKKTYF